MASRSPMVPRDGSMELSDEECAVFVRADRERHRQAVRPSRQRLAGGGLVSLVVLGGVAVRLSRPQRGSGHKDRANTEFVTLAEDERCHTAEEGEPCYKDVRWAMTTGIQVHPEWYAAPCSHLNPRSSFEEFQACVYKINMTSCPLPCNPMDSVFDELAARSHQQARKHHEVHLTDPCHIAKPGEDCYDDVLDAMSKGLIRHPSRFPGLTADSSFEDFQMALYRDPESSSCPRPCKCKTAIPGEECYKHVRWAKEIGIRGHPEWYHGISATATFEEIQAYLAKDSKGACSMPCTKTDGARSSLRGEGGHAGAVRETECLTSNWPDVKNNLVCGRCKVLVGRFASHYKTCNGYCKSMGRKCTGAWMDYEDTCSVLYPMNCEEVVVLDDALCECGEAGDGLPLKAGAAHRPDSEDILADLTNILGERPGEEGDPLGEPVGPPSRSDGRDDLGQCRTSVYGEVCYDDVVFGMTKGIREHPEWYPGLSTRSEFEEFQKILHGNPELKCPKPCPCHTARAGENCSENVQWVLREGIAQHPSWYQGLTARSRFEEVQQRLHEDENTTCLKPCTMTKWETPSLFCIAVFRSEGYERDLLHAQLKKSVGVFSCDDFAIMADKKLKLADGIETLVIPPNEKVGVSKDGTAANTLIFMKAWLVIWYDARWQPHDWIIKADPDAVILPNRIRDHLRPHTGKNVYVKNCMKYSGPGWPMMFGSVEAFSNEALMTYMKGAERCRKELQWQAWGEDLYMGKCITMLGGGSVFDGGLIGDNVCKGANCADHSVAAFHPFKSVDAWFECYNTATR